MTTAPPSLASIEAQLADIEAEALRRIEAAGDASELEKVRVGVLGKKGSLTGVLRALSGLSAAERPKGGKLANAVKQTIEAAVSGRVERLAQQARAERLRGPRLDVTLPAAGQPRGHIHPLSAVMDELCDVFRSLGFSIVEGPEIEDDFHNFEALNIPADHPARDMQDTFFVDGGRLLRTHTSPVQIRTMENGDPPLMIVAPGTVYRHDDDITHSPMFHQIEGLMVGTDITFRHLKGVLTAFLGRTFGAELPLRFRPSYFPFTEPSAEVDIGCVMCGGTGKAVQTACRVCKGSGWLEVLGSGMVNPEVFRRVGYDAERYTGFAFGIGVERIAMLKLRIDDIRLFYVNDMRFLEQF